MNVTRRLTGAVTLWLFFLRRDPLAASGLVGPRRRTGRVPATVPARLMTLGCPKLRSTGVTMPSEQESLDGQE